MICNKCGKALIDTAKFCNYCGSKVVTNAPKSDSSNIPDFQVQEGKTPHEQKEGILSKVSRFIEERKEQKLKAIEEQKRLEEERRKEEEKRLKELQELKEQKISKILSGEFPIIENPPAIMKNNELCSFATPVDLFETKNRKKTTYVGGTTGLSLRVTKGVYWRVGGFKGEPITRTWEETVKVDEGNLLFTNKRVIFVGDKKSFSINLGKILSFEMYSDGIEIKTEGRKTEQICKFRNNEDPEVVGMLLQKIIESNVT